MSHDRQLIDTIKDRFARKSSAQLQEIVRANDRERWSVEAIAAAHEVLLDRAAGRSQEPLVLEEERLPPSPGHSINSVAALAGLSLLTFPLGFIVIPRNNAHQEDEVARDKPVPFGSRAAWLAVDSADTAAVATALDLRELRDTAWQEGIAAAYKVAVFVTPPLGDWTLAAGVSLFPPERVEAFVRPLLERLSLQFGEAQYFCTHEDVGLHVWARARKGRLVRGYGWLGEKGLTLWNEGAPTKDERELGFRFSDRQSAGKVPAVPDEGCVMQLASLWSIDPTSLDEHFKEPVMGLLGSVPGVEAKTGRSS